MTITAADLTPAFLVQNVFPMACKATTVVPAQDATASVSFSSGPFSCPEFQRVAATPQIFYIVAGILAKESSFNWAVCGSGVSNGPGTRTSPGVPGTQATFIANYNAALALGAPGIIATPPGTPQDPYSPQQVLSAQTCSVLNQASRAQGLAQCLGTYHLANTSNSPFSSISISRGLIYPIYYPPFGDYGINGIYNGPNVLAGAINGFIAMMALMHDSLSQGKPVTENWNDGDVAAIGRSVLNGGTANQLQAGGSPPSNPEDYAGATVFSPSNSGGNPVAC